MSVRKNVLANYLGQGWTALINLAFVPVYIRYLGIEAYGLIGFFAALQSCLTLLDMGMTPTLCREVARLSAIGQANSLHVLVRTFEVISVGVALAIAAALVFTSNWLARDWLNPDSLAPDVVSGALSVMGLVAAFRFVEGLYRGAILGFQNHVWLNAATAGLATIRALGAVAVLAWIDPGIQAFFWWQALISAVTVLAFRVGAHRHLPPGDQPAVFSLEALSGTWKFAGGMLATTVLSLALTQIDKVILSKLLSLETFGTYTFAAAVSGALYSVISPVAQSYYPRFTELVAKGDSQSLALTYHQAAQLMTVMVTPAGLMLIAFGKPILVAWTGNEHLAGEAAMLISVLSIGTILNGWMHIPYMLQLAAGWPSFAAWTNLVAVSVLVPALFWIVPQYGAIGAACVWVAVNTGYVLIAIPFMHTRLLQDEKWRWYFVDTLTPAISASLVISLAYLVDYDPTSNLNNLSSIAVTAFLAFSGALATSPALRIFFASRSVR